MIDTIHLFTQIRKKAGKSSFKPDHEFIKKAVDEFKIRKGEIKLVEFCEDEFDLFRGPFKEKIHSQTVQHFNGELWK